jgi:hypothetical protein
MRKLIPWFLFLLLFINVVYVFSGVINFPFQSMDVYADWFLKAKVLYLSTSFPLSFFQDWFFIASHMQYPLLLPFFYSLIYQIFGLNEMILLLLYPVFYFLILVSCYKTLRATKISQNFALLLTYVYSILSPLLAQGGRMHAGNADVVVVLIAWLAIRLIQSNMSREKVIVLLTLCVMIVSQIKLEGYFMIILLVFLPEISGKQRVVALLFASIPFVIWQYIVKHFGFAGDYTYHFIDLQTHVSRTWIVVSGYLREMLNYKNWYIFWPFLGFLSLMRLQITEKTKSVLVPASLVMFLCFISSYVFFILHPPRACHEYRAVRRIIG